jgi:hypothetical protein
MRTTPPSKPNPIHIAPLFRWMLIALALCAYGLAFVHVKNQQHLLGQGVREIERRLAEERAANETLLARISALSSRAELQRKLQQGFIALAPIPQHSIAVLAPPAEVTATGFARAAAADLRVP